MSRVLITGSADGLGLVAGQLLAGPGHAVTLQARNEVRARTPRPRCPPPSWSSPATCPPWPASGRRLLSYCADLAGATL
jgi:NAD(P)-dependent dehydrogenase (short-subunit alcohol dehydrogenase family)